MLRMCCNGFEVFFTRFCKCCRRMFQMFHPSFLYATIIAPGCFKSRLGVAHGMQSTSGLYVSARNASVGRRRPSSMGHRMDTRNGGAETDCRRGRPFKRSDARSVRSNECLFTTARSSRAQITLTAHNLTTATSPRHTRPQPPSGTSQLATTSPYAP
jgi:hypothetical protein